MTYELQMQVTQTNNAIVERVNNDFITLYKLAPKFPTKALTHYVLSEYDPSLWV